MTAQRAVNSKRVGRKVGYAVAIACNIALLVIANNILDWGWLPWLTEEFRQVLPVMNVSLGASIAANAIYLFYDPPGFKAAAELGLLIVSLIVTIRFLQVFPFDFTAYEFGWGTLARWLLVLAIVGICIGMLVQVVQLVRLGAQRAAKGSTSI
ncbi:MAG: hypothetical protein MUE66_04910 [Acidimicrobiia bacterium]|jgi:hypothetical protein|nr:hypothetical protein [Acidimicrobiia bacterium]